MERGSGPRAGSDPAARVLAAAHRQGATRYEVRGLPAVALAPELDRADGRECGLRHFVRGLAALAAGRPAPEDFAAAAELDPRSRVFRAFRAEVPALLGHAGASAPAGVPATFGAAVLGCDGFAASLRSAAAAKLRAAQARAARTARKTDHKRSGPKEWNNTARKQVMLAVTGEELARLVVDDTLAASFDALMVVQRDGAQTGSSDLVKWYLTVLGSARLEKPLFVEQASLEELARISRATDHYEVVLIDLFPALGGQDATRACLAASAAFASELILVAQCAPAPNTSATFRICETVDNFEVALRLAEKRKLSEISRQNLVRWFLAEFGLLTSAATTFSADTWPGLLKTAGFDSVSVHVAPAQPYRAIVVSATVPEPEEENPEASAGAALEEQDGRSDALRRGAASAASAAAERVALAAAAAQT